jgi:hypothetical protein
VSAPGGALAEQMQRIRATILARHGIDPEREGVTVAHTSPVEEAARLATINAHWGIASDLPVVGPLLVLFRRVLRLTLRWYINPIVEQQSTFNEAAVRALYDLRIENEHLRAELDRLRGLMERSGE